MWLLQRQRRQKAWCSSGQIICYSTHFCFLGVLCWRLWCWLYVSWLLGFSPWMTRSMGWSYVAVSSSGRSFLPVEVRDGEDPSWAQVRGLNLNPPYHCPCLKLKRFVEFYPMNNSSSNAKLNMWSSFTNNCFCPNLCPVNTALIGNTFNYSKNVLGTYKIRFIIYMFIPKIHDWHHETAAVVVWE